MTKLSDFLRISEAAEYLGVSPNTLRNWENADKIVAHRHPVNGYRLFKQKELDNVLQEQEGEYEPDTRFAVVWFEQHGFEAGEFGTAATLATAKAISVDGVVDAGILHSAGGPTAECLPPRRCL